MKNFIVLLETFNLGCKAAQIITDFDTFEEAENQMTALVESEFVSYADTGHSATLKLKQQDHNRWWVWDKETGQGWLPIENESVKASREKCELTHRNAEYYIARAARLEKFGDRPTSDAACAYRSACAKRNRAQGALLIAEAERDHLKVVLEAHGNIEWPMVD